MIHNILASASLLATPILLAALGGLVNRRGGIINIALEGKMVAGAFVGFLVGATAGSWLLGLVAAALTGLVIGLVFSLLVTRLGANEILAGLGLIIGLPGLIGFLLQRFWDVSGTLRFDGAVRMPRSEIPLVHDVPWVGAVLSGNDPLTYASWLLVPVTAYVLTQTRVGLRLRATGSAEDAVVALGLPMRAIRDASTAWAGMLAALGGAHLSLGFTRLFNEGMTAGRGFIAVAAFFFGRARPLPTAAAVTLFAIFDAAQIRLQGQGLPSQLVQMLPYLVVIVALAVAGYHTSRERTRRLVVSQ